MPGIDLLLGSLMQPIVLAFVLGLGAGFIRSELELPDAVIKLLSIYLLFSLGLTGGRELAEASMAEVWPLALTSLGLALAIPTVAYLVVRQLGKLDISNAAALAAHYGSVSTATFFTSMAYAGAMGTPAQGTMAAMVALMEFGVVYSLALARWQMSRGNAGSGTRDLLLSVLRGRGIVLLLGGMAIGALASDSQWGQIEPFYKDLFRGMLMLFLLEMGITAARQIRGFREAGRFVLVFAIAMPIFNGLLGVTLGHWLGLSVGSAFVLGAICASASFIDAPAACRASLPEASPGIYLTASLGITLPFNLLLGLPLYYQYAQWLAA